MYSSYYGSSYPSSYYSSSSSTADINQLSSLIGGLIGGLIGFIIVIGIVAVLVMVARWFIFKKAERKPWESLIPIHSDIVEMELGGIETYWYFLNFAAVIPFVGWIAPVVLVFWKNIALAKAFGKSGGFGVGLTLLSPIFYPILAWGSATYVGPEKKESK